MVNLTKGQIRMANLTKPYPFNITNLIKSWPFDGRLYILTKYLTGHLVKKVILIICIGQM